MTINKQELIALREKKQAALAVAPSTEAYAFDRGYLTGQCNLLIDLIKLLD